MKALSIQQPWAWLIVNRYKHVENRDWPTKQRGEILIHTGKKFDKEGYDWIKDEFPEIPMPSPAEFQKGGIVGKVSIVDCVSKMDSPWFFGRFGFVMEGAEPLPFHACNGQLGFFEVEVPA
jgi:hypothetical protein